MSKKIINASLDLRRAFYSRLSREDNPNIGLFLKKTRQELTGLPLDKITVSDLKKIWLGYKRRNSFYQQKERWLDKVLTTSLRLQYLAAKLGEKFD